MSIKLLKTNGLKNFKILHLTTIAIAIKNDGKYAYITFNVGKEYASCKSFVTISMDGGTPYIQVTNAVGGWVAPNGNLYIEVYGYGFIPQHTFALNILLFN